ncbi:cytochrome P450 oxidoreductase [Lepidopterella palustris CBS 459.81]|uniref:Cytochrome P450 oxidoreductase n=1 Tax=Lepidopterella palustris CBS 459.81 TaxID=1314670 RepID=A0A8E2J9D5_9PEZI|nr:cytochrome P450 oxidoreductase [Lepidopterella palustris CBS 459.81]
MSTLSLLTPLHFLKSNFLALIFAFILWIPARFLYRRLVSPLAHLPGPLLASGSRVWKLWSVYNGHTETDHINLHAKYGPVVRLAPDEVSFASPAAAKDILAVGKGFRKTDFYTCFPIPDNPDIFTEIDEGKHALLKRFAVGPYSLASMMKLVPFMDEVGRELIGKLDGIAGVEGRVCDLGDWLHYFAFDVLGEVAFSVRFGFLAQGKDVGGCIKSIDDIQWYDGIVGQVPPLDYLFRRNPLLGLLRFLPFLAPSPPLIVQMAFGEVEKRIQGGKYVDARKDILGQLMEAREGNPDKLTDANVVAVAFGAIGAGSDSTASTMQSFMYLVLSYQDVYKKLETEILAAEKAGQLSDMITYAEAQQLPYFQACLKESMRLRPAVGLDMQRFVPADGAQIDGVYYPGGIRASVNGWVLHRHQETFGKDADVFRPERWLEGDDREMARCMFQFGGGSHLCIGRNLALLEMNKILPQLIRRYHFELVYPERPLKHHSTFFVVQKGLEVYIRKREI